MFSLFRKKKPKLELPPFSAEMQQAGRDTVSWCHSQIGDYLGGPPQPMPDYGLHQDVMIGSYVCGFVQGHFIVSGLLQQWSKGDADLANLGFSILVGPWIGFVLGDHSRSVTAMDHLPQVGPARGGLGIQQIDEMGGNDGMCHARGEEKQFGGLLRYYLEKNLPRN